MQEQWSYLAKGSYNIAYVNHLNTKVLKLQRAGSDDQLDKPERSVRLWNQINSHISPPAIIQEHRGTIGWVCPFVEGRQATDREMRVALIDIFNSSGRIVADATSPKNFVTTESGQVVCIDIGMALQLEERENELYSDKNNRKRSIASLTEWMSLVDNFQLFFKQSKREYPQTVDIVKALLFIKKNRPDVSNVDFLKEDLKFTAKLAQAYDVQYKPRLLTRKKIIGAIEKLDKIETAADTPPEVRKGRAILSEKRPITTGSIKESCQKELNNYIKSRGSLDNFGMFSPGLVTRIFRKQMLTEKRVQYVRALMESIEQSNSIEEIREKIRSSITEVLKDPLLKQATFGNGLMRSLGVCQTIISAAVKLKPELEDKVSCSLK